LLDESLAVRAAILAQEAVRSLGGGSYATVSWPVTCRTRCRLAFQRFTRRCSTRLRVMGPRPY